MLHLQHDMWNLEHYSPVYMINFKVEKIKVNIATTRAKIAILSRPNNLAT